MIKIIFLIFFTLILLTGCVSNANKQGVVVKINEHQLSKSFKKSFPYEKDFMFGAIKLDNPIIKMHKTENRIKAGVSLGLKTVFTNSIKGSFLISGEPKFNKHQSTIFLTNVKLEDFNFGKLEMSDDFIKNFKTSIEPIINEIFKKYPIYKIPDDAILGSFIKDVRINESNLLVTYGL